MIHDYGIYFVIIFSVSTVNVAKDPSLISWRRVFLVIRGSDDEIWIILVGVLGDIPWGASVPLVSCFDIIVCLFCVLSCCIVGCLGMDHEVVISVIRSMDPNSLQ